ncbi:MAG: hypothetical protein AVDCRST_MAG85-2739, partial [uncultured Solirubrobacteraceae bacterium]
RLPRSSSPALRSPSRSSRSAGRSRSPPTWECSPWRSSPAGRSAAPASRGWGSGTRRRRSPSWRSAPRSRSSSRSTPCA